MCGGYPIDLKVGLHKHRFRTSEALYQCFKFPFNPDIQFQIQEKASPMAAKMVAKAHADKIHPAWFEDKNRIDAMMFALRAKLRTNLKFLFLLNRTGVRTIVEDSHKDKFWGAVPVRGGYFGENNLGRCLMRLREGVFSNPSILDEPLIIKSERYPFALFGSEIPPLECNYV